MGYSDTISQAICDILKGVAHYNEYSFDYKKQTINALANLYLILYESTPPLREPGEPAPVYGLKEAKATATREWHKAHTRQAHYD